jgi:hypothetical protein
VRNQEIHIGGKKFESHRGIDSLAACRAGQTNCVDPYGSGAHDDREDACEDRAEDSPPAGRWRAGIFYLNREDPSIFVQKRFGTGYTLNFGQPMAWLLLVVLLIVILVPLLVSVWTFHELRHLASEP